MECAPGQIDAMCSGAHTPGHTLHTLQAHTPDTLQNSKHKTRIENTKTPCIAPDGAPLVQRYLAHKKLPPFLGPRYGPRHRPTVGSWGGAVSSQRGTPVPPPPCSLAPFLRDAVYESQLRSLVWRWFRGGLVFETRTLVSLS